MKYESPRAHALAKLARRKPARRGPLLRMARETEQSYRHNRDHAHEYERGPRLL